jgi:urease accessory protein
MLTLRATAVRTRGHWHGVPVDDVVLPFSERRRRRLAMTGRGGSKLLLDLPQVITLRDGDALVLEDGRLIAVRAADEALHEITCTDQLRLMRIAWHLGNRHLPTEIAAGSLRIAADPVIADMARGLGATVHEIQAPFDPEGGAYAASPSAEGTDAHGHGHGHHGHHHHDHDHEH